MGGDMQKHFLHSVPPGGGPGQRFNLTFRVCRPRPEVKANGPTPTSHAVGSGSIGGMTQQPHPSNSSEDIPGEMRSAGRGIADVTSPAGHPEDDCNAPKSLGWP
eukprot:6940967-Karenia_brevis.AAC.1